MKYDTVIIGGGLSGLTAGIRLSLKGLKAAVISSGQGALHFNSGSFGLLGHDAHGNAVCNPVEGIGALPAAHPYSKIGSHAIRGLAAEAKRIFADAGLTLKGDADKNHYRLTPMGFFEPAWLTMDDYAACEDPADTGWGKTAIINLKGYLDFMPGFLADGLLRHGLECRTAAVSVPALDKLRKSPTGMRAATIAKTLTGRNLELLAGEIRKAAEGSETVLFPAVIGIDSEKPATELRSMLKQRLFFVPVLPMSACGLRAQTLLRRYFENLGGTYLLGDNVTAAHFNDNTLREIETANLAGMRLQADNFILATGSFFSQGLKSDPTRVFEPLLGADVDAPADPAQWCAESIFDNQPYMRFGVATDSDFHVTINGAPAKNVFAAGSVVGGADSVGEGSGGGVAILSALHTADIISSLPGRIN